MMRCVASKVRIKRGEENLKISVINSVYILRMEAERGQGCEQKYKWVCQGKTRQKIKGCMIEERAVDVEVDSKYPNVSIS